MPEQHAEPTVKQQVARAWAAWISVLADLVQGTGADLDIVDEAGLVVLDKDVDAALAAVGDLERELKVAREAARDFAAVVSESRGIAGWHLNDAEATWDEFEWVAVLERLGSRAALAPKEADSE